MKNLTLVHANGRKVVLKMRTNTGICDHSFYDSDGSLIAFSLSTSENDFGYIVESAIACGYKEESK